jgi:hypothetical protein
MANYPTSASTDANLHVAVNSLATAIVGALTSVGGNNGSDIEVVSTTNFPSTGFITIDTEAISYTGILSGPPRFTGITRGADGTTATAHSAGAACKHNVIAAHHNATKDEVVAVTTDLVAAHGTLNDNDTPAATATDIKDRLDHMATQIKKISGQANWYTTIPSRMGKLLQIAVGTGTTTSSTTSGTFADSVVTGSITPSRTDSNVLVIVNFTGDVGNAVSGQIFGAYRLKRNGSSLTNVRGAIQINEATNPKEMFSQQTLIHYDSPASTSPVTYTIEIAIVGSGTFRVNSQNYAWTVTMIEVAA